MQNSTYGTNTVNRYKDTFMGADVKWMLCQTFTATRTKPNAQDEPIFQVQILTRRSQVWTVQLTHEMFLIISGCLNKTWDVTDSLFIME